MPHLPAIRGIFDLRCRRFAVNYYGFPFDAPGRLALPARHRLRLRRMPGGLGGRASLEQFHSNPWTLDTWFLIPDPYFFFPTCPVKFFAEKERSEFNWGFLFPLSYFLVPAP